MLNPPAVELGGDSDTVLSGVIAPGLGYGVIAASVARYIFDLADWENSAWIVPMGVSGHPGSPHYTDQLDKWSNTELLPMPYAWESIIGNAQAHQRLVTESSGG